MDYIDDFDFSRPYLTGDEYILWKGKPEKGALFTGADLFTTLFSLFWLGFSLVWEIIAITSGAPLFFGIFGLPFVAVGVYLLFGRFIYTAYLRKRTAYVLTNKKIIRKRGNKIDMLDSRDMMPMELTLHRNGNGTISFGYTTVEQRRRGGRSYSYMSNSTGGFSLENIRDAAEVQKMISNLETE